MKQHFDLFRDCRANYPDLRRIILGMGIAESTGNAFQTELFKVTASSQADFKQSIAEMQDGKVQLGLPDLVELKVAAFSGLET